MTETTTPEPIRTALIGGLGYAGTVFHTPLLQSLPNLFTLAYVVDIVRRSDDDGSGSDNPDDHLPPSFVETFGSNVKFTTHFNDILEDGTIELVIITTPNNTHFKFAKSALEAGKHVLLDKPVTTTYAEAQELGELANLHDRVLYAFQNRRWDSDYLTVQKMLREKALGNVIDFVSHYDRYRDYLKGTWKEVPGPGSGQFYSLGPHLIDQALHCFGRPERVTAFIENIRGMGNESVDDDFTVILHYARTPSNPYILTAILRGHLLSLRRNQLRFTIRGSKGTLSKFGMDVQEEQMKQDGVEAFKAPDFGREPEDIWATLETNGESGIVSTKIESERGCYQDLYKNLAAVIQDGAEPAVKWKEAELAMLITELAIQSAKEGRTIYVPPEEKLQLQLPTPPNGYSPAGQSLEEPAISPSVRIRDPLRRRWS